MCMVSMIISGVHCSEYERKELIAMLQGKKKQNKEESFSSILDKEMKKLEPSKPTKDE